LLLRLLKSLFDLILGRRRLAGVTLVKITGARILIGKRGRKLFLLLSLELLQVAFVFTLLSFCLLLVCKLIRLIGFHCLR
jgi:hypothetical protein